MSSVLLEPDQEELLTRLVEAHRSVPRDQREPFLVLVAAEGNILLHPGLPDDTSVFEGDLHVLESEGLLSASNYAAKSRSLVITPTGLAVYEELKRRAGTPAQQVEEAVVRYLDSSAFQARYPQAHRRWSEAAELLWASDSERQLTTIGHRCREAMQEFATALVERHQPPGVDRNKAHDVARIKVVLNQHALRLGTTTAPFLDALLPYWGTVSDLVQRQAHGAQREGQPLVWEDARRVIFQTAVVMFEVDRSLELPAR